MSQPALANRRQVLLLSLALLTAIVAAVLTSVFLVKSLLQTAVAESAHNNTPTTFTAIPWPPTVTQSNSSSLDSCVDTQTSSSQTSTTGEGMVSQSNSSAITTLIKYLPATSTTINNTTNQVNSIVDSFNTTITKASKSIKINNKTNYHTNYHKVIKYQPSKKSYDDHHKDKHPSSPHKSSYHKTKSY